MSQTLNIGLLFLPSFQWLDAVGTSDLLNNHSRETLSSVSGVSKNISDKAPSIKWHFISNNMDPVKTTTGPPQHPTTTYKDCPPLDYLVVPGPYPIVPLPEGCNEFLQARYVDPHVKAILLVCTASLAVSQAGILDGHKVCTNKFVLRDLIETGGLASFSKKVEWVGDRRWIVDGKIWSSAGITAGLDLAAEFAKVHFDEEVVKLALEMSEYSPLPDKPDQFAFLLEGVKTTV